MSIKICVSPIHALEMGHLLTTQIRAICQRQIKNKKCEIGAPKSSSGKLWALPKETVESMSQIAGPSNSASPSVLGKLLRKTSIERSYTLDTAVSKIPFITEEKMLHCENGKAERIIYT